MNLAPQIKKRSVFNLDHYRSGIFEALTEGQLVSVLRSACYDNLRGDELLALCGLIKHQRRIVREKLYPEEPEV